MHQHAHPLPEDGQIQPGAPDHHAADHQRQHAHHQAPEQHLLAPVVLALLRHVMVVAVDHLLDVHQPPDVTLLDVVELPEARRHDDEEERHADTEVRMQDPRPRAATKELGEREEGRMEHRQPRQHQRDEEKADERG